MVVYAPVANARIPMTPICDPVGDWNWIVPRTPAAAVWRKVISRRTVERYS
jgi:hypothetical protein